MTAFCIIEEKYIKQIDAVRLEGPLCRESGNYLDIQFIRGNTGCLAEEEVGGLRPAELIVQLTQQQYAVVCVCVHGAVYMLKREQWSGERMCQTPALMRPQT